jgi:predicted esterase
MTSARPATPQGAEDLGFVHRYEKGSDGTTLLLLHGTGGDENDLIPIAKQLAPGANLLSPRGQVLEHGMPRFFERLAVGVFNEEDLRKRAADLSAFVRAAAARYGFDAGRVYAMGFSNGANMAAGLLLLDGSLLAGAALLRAIVPLEPPRMPDLTGKPVLLAAGLGDPYAPHEKVDRLAELLKKSGAVVDLRWAKADHSLVPSDFKAIVDWLNAIRPS